MTANNFSSLTAYLQNDPANNINQRLPPLSLPGIYPYVRLFQYRDGSWTRQDETPGQEGYSRGHISGTFNEHSPLGGHKTLITGMSHHYTTQGSTATTDLNHHNKIGGSTVEHVGADHFSEHFGNKIHAVGGDTIHASGGVHFQHATSRVEQSTTGNWVTDANDGDHHFNVDGDHVQYTGGTHYHSVSGEKGTYLPNGNYDIKLDQGSFQVNAMANVILNSSSQMKLNALSNITITSLTQITLQVGSQSIIINQNGITINATTLNITQVV